MCERQGAPLGWFELDALPELENSAYLMIKQAATGNDGSRRHTHPSAERSVGVEVSIEQHEKDMTVSPVGVMHPMRLEVWAR